MGPLPKILLGLALILAVVLCTTFGGSYAPPSSNQKEAAPVASPSPAAAEPRRTLSRTRLPTATVAKPLLPGEAPKRFAYAPLSAEPSEAGVQRIMRQSYEDFLAEAHLTPEQERALRGIIYDVQAAFAAGLKEAQYRPLELTQEELIEQSLIARGLRPAKARVEMPITELRHGLERELVERAKEVIPARTAEDLANLNLVFGTRPLLFAAL